LLDATRAGPMRFRLESGTVIEATESGPFGEAVTLAVRPERASLTPPGGTALSARVEQVIYVGSDTIYLIVLDGGQRFRVRAQNREGPQMRARAGDVVGVQIPKSAVRVLQR